MNFINAYSLLLMRLPISFSIVLHFNFCSSIAIFLSSLLMIAFSRYPLASSLLLLLIIVTIDSVNIQLFRMAPRAMCSGRDWSQRNFFNFLLWLKMFSIMDLSSSSLRAVVVDAILLVVYLYLEESGLLPIDDLGFNGFFSGSYTSQLDCS